MAGPFDFTGQNIEDSYQRVLQTDGTNLYDGTGSLFSLPSAFPYTGSAQITGSLGVTGSIGVSGSGLVTIGLSGSAYGSTGTSNGKLTINNTSGNNAIAIRNGETGYQLGIKTTVNDAIGTEFVWFDGATTTFLQYGGVGGRLGASNFAQFRVNNYNPDGNATIHTGFGNPERLRVTNAGLIGIGTTTPSSSLHIKGATSSSLSSSLLIQNANNSSSLTVLDNGYVGINTSSAQYTLDVNGIINNTHAILGEANIDKVAIYTAASGDYRIRGFAYAGALTIASGYLYSGGKMVLYGQNHATNANNIYLTDKVGIGTTSPTYKLDVSGSIRSTNGVNITGSFSSYTTSSAGFLAVVSGSQPLQDAAFNFRKIGESPDGGRHTMIVEGSGAQDNNIYFGIGQAGGTKGSILCVKGNSSVNINMPLPTLNYGGLAVGGWLSSYPSLLVRGFGATSATTAVRVENTNLSSSLVILDNGNVGLGTATPAAQLSLQVAGDTPGDMLTLRNRAGTYDKLAMGWSANGFNSYIGFGGGNGFYLNFINNSGGANVMQLHDQGPVLIGAQASSRLAVQKSTVPTSITIPNSYLFVDMKSGVGGLNAVGTIAFGGPYTNPSSYISYLNQSQGDFGKGALLFGMRATSSADNPATEYMRLTNTGNFLIGSQTDANYRLDVSGSTRLQGSGTTSATNAFVVNNAISDELLRVRNDGVIFAANRIRVPQLSVSAINSVDNAYTVLETNNSTGTAKFNNSVGIGSSVTSPLARLHIKGSGATSATTALRVENTNASASLVVLDNGVSTFTSTSSSLAPIDIVNGTTTDNARLLRFLDSSGTTNMEIRRTQTSGKGIELYYEGNSTPLIRTDANNFRLNGTLSLNGANTLTFANLGSNSANFGVELTSVNQILNFKFGVSNSSTSAFTTGFLVNYNTTTTSSQKFEVYYPFVVTGSARITGSFDVSGSARITNGLIISSSTTINDELVINIPETDGPIDDTRPAGFYKATVNGAVVFLPYYL